MPKEREGPRFWNGATLSEARREGKQNGSSRTPYIFTTHVLKDETGGASRVECSYFQVQNSKGSRRPQRVGEGGR